jgi:hypothetical protein
MPWAVHHMWCGWSSGRVSMTMVVMTVLIDDPAEYQIMICLMTVVFRI